jgi:hypothetical protein
MGKSLGTVQRHHGDKAFAVVNTSTKLDIRSYGHKANKDHCSIWRWLIG